MATTSTRSFRTTPGPWVAEADSVFADNAPEGEKLIAECLNSNADGNARLIAAAPELLDALKRFVWDGALQTFEDRERFRQVARSAIAKAEGR